MRNRFILLTIFLILGAFVTFAEAEPRVVSDINSETRAVSSSPEGFSRFGDKLLFQAGDFSAYGRELWITDGTAEGTQLVRDLRLGRSFGDPQWMTELNGLALFAGDDGVHGNELWVTDGTTEGTRMLVDVFSVGTLDGDPEYLTLYKDRIYFSAEDRVVGQELFVSDGTEAGTQAFTDLNPGLGDSDPVHFTVANGLLFFIADTPEAGEELWVTDGTVGGTRLVKDIRPGTSDADIELMTAVPSGLFFSADDGVTGDELWFSDGSESGTVLVRDIRPGSGSSRPRDLALVDGTLFFRAGTADFGDELWKSDGSESGTVLVKDIRAGTSGSGPSELTALGNLLVFSAFTDAEQAEPWVSDGTEAGTFLLRDIADGNSASSPSDLVAVGDNVYFGARDGLVSQLWKTDGTSAGTVKLKDVRVVSRGIEIDGLYLFSGDDGVSGAELWITDGTPQGTRLVKNLISDAGSSSPNFITAVGDEVYFGALEGIGIEGGTPTRIYGLWKSGGTGASTERMTFLTSQNNPGDLRQIANLNDTAAIFSGRVDMGTGVELGISDGTPEGTRILQDIWPGFQSSNPDSFVGFNDHLYFTTALGNLWRTDGTEAGTVIADQIRTSLTPVVVLGSLYYQGAEPLTGGGQLWKSATGLDTATEVAVINPGAFAQIGEITEFNGALYFRATDQGVNNNETELWTSDGVSGASEVKDIWPGPEGSTPLGLVVVGDHLFFAADDGTHGNELWKSDGSPSGTVMVKDIRPGAASSHILRNLIGFNGDVFFAADDGVSGVELWKSDGTAEGTQLVKDIYPGPFSSLLPYEWNPVELDGKLYFTAADPDVGYELWQTDGTEDGTYCVFDLVPGPESSAPEQLTVAGNKLYFAAYSALSGRELWVFDPSFLKVPFGIRREGNQVVLDWQTYLDRTLQLESGDDLIDWEPVTVPTTISGERESVSLPFSEGRQFFRLIEP